MISAQASACCAASPWRLWRAQASPGSGGLRHVWAPEGPEPPAVIPRRRLNYSSRAARPLRSARPPAGHRGPRAPPAPGLRTPRGGGGAACPRHRPQERPRAGMRPPPPVSSGFPGAPPALVELTRRGFVLPAWGTFRLPGGAYSTRGSPGSRLCCKGAPWPSQGGQLIRGQKLRSSCVFVFTVTWSRSGHCHVRLVLPTQLKAVFQASGEGM